MCISELLDLSKELEFSEVRMRNARLHTLHGVSLVYISNCTFCMYMFLYDVISKS